MDAPYLEQRAGGNAVFGGLGPAAAAFFASAPQDPYNKIYAPQRTTPIHAFVAGFSAGRVPFIEQRLDGNAVFGMTGVSGFAAATPGNCIFDVQTFQGVDQASNHWSLDEWEKWKKREEEPEKKKARREADEVIERARRQAKEKLEALEREQEKELAVIEAKTKQVEALSAEREAVIQARQLAELQLARDNEDLLILLLMASD